MKGSLLMSPNASRILLVEDDSDQAQLFCLLLSMDGYEVIMTPDAESALVRLTEAPVALLLADWSLPGMKGDALIRAVKPLYPEIKTILFSNHMHVDEAATACGADGWFRKMDNSTHLRQLVANLLREGTGGQGSQATPRPAA